MSTTTVCRRALLRQKATALCVLLLIFLVNLAAYAENTIVRCEIQRGTNALGTMDIELFDTDKPETVRNFLLYVRSGAYSNTFFHRCVPGFVVQGGGYTVTNLLSGNSFSSYQEVTNYGRLMNEFSTGPKLSNTLGTIAMAKVGDDPNSATSQWFFNLANNTNLDTQNGGFTVFGRIVSDSTSSNIIAHFNSLTTSTGIVNLRTLIGQAYAAFNELPVAITNNRAPLYRELYPVRFSVLNDTNVPGQAPPTVRIVSPALNSTFTNQSVTISGTAADDTGIARVVYRFGTNAAQGAFGTTNWQFTVSPQNGLNTYTVESIDWDGNRSSAATVTFLYLAQVPLDLEIRGSGRVVGAADGQYLQVGTYQTLTAIPSSGYIFHSWTGTFTSSVATITFLVPTNATNISLTAKFITEPLPRLTGTYKGLFRSTGGTPAAVNSGHMTLQLQATGDFDGTILHAGGSYTYTGKFDSSGQALIQGIVGGVQRSITLELQKLNSEGLITGFINGANELRLERVASTNSYGISTGKYTFAIPPATTGANDQLNPAGYGFGSCTVDTMGTLTFNGRLGDGQAFSGTAPLTRLQRWPMYVNLFNGRGVVLGWLAAGTNGNGNLDGTLHYIKGFKATDPTYPAGFSNQVVFIGSRYPQPQAGERVVDWVHGLASFAGPFQIGISNIVKLTSDNTLMPWDDNQNSITWNLDPVTGMLNGTFIDLWSGTTRTLRGVVLKRTQRILGQFVDRGTVGSLVLGKSPFLVTQTVNSVTLPAVLAALNEGGYLKFMTNVDVTFTASLTLPYDTALDANGYSVVFRGGQTTRLLRVSTNHTLFAKGVTFADGKIVGTAGANTSPPQAGGDGRAAGIMNLGGFVALTNCVLTNFFCQGGVGGKDKSAGVVASGGRGAGAAIYNQAGRVILHGCQLWDNLAEGGAGNAGTNSGLGLQQGCGAGGAVFSDGGECIIEGSTFLRNTASGGPGRTESGSLNRAGDAVGGAVAVSGARLQIANSEFLANRALGPNSWTNNQTVGAAHGGAIFIETNSVATIDLSTLLDNLAIGGNSSSGQLSGIARGGGILNRGALQVRRSTIEQNAATSGSNGVPGSASGGGIASFGSLVLDASTMSYNLARGGSLAAGGGLLSQGGTFSATNSTFAFNSAAADSTQDVHGGGIMLVSNTAVMAYITLAFNSASGTNDNSGLGGGIEHQDSSLRLRSSILSSNVPRNLLGLVIDDGYNLSSDNSVVLFTTGSTNNINAMLGPLSTNGGPTRTMSLLASSPARDLVPTNITPAVPAFDQRGTARAQGGRADAGAVELTPNELPPFIVTHPVGGNVRAGTNFTFQTVASGAAPLSYNWLSNDVPIVGATNSILQVTNVQTFDAYIDYRVVVSNRFGAATSVLARLTVDSRPLVSIQPTNIVTPPGAAVSFTVVASGPALSYTWYHDGLPVAGANGPTLAFASAAAGMQGAYRVVITNFAGSTNSQIATLTFNALALSFIQQPTNTTIFEGQSGGLSAIVSGVQPISYSWLLGFTPIVNATNQDLSFAPAALSDQGTYRLLITNAYLSVTSAPALLTVLRQPQLSIALDGSNVLISSRGTPNRTHHLLQATSLTAQVWTAVATNIAPSSGTSIWTRPLINSENRFYRVLMP